MQRLPEDSVNAARDYFGTLCTETSMLMSVRSQMQLTRAKAGFCKLLICLGGIGRSGEI